MATVSEKEIEKSILSWLQILPHIFAWKNNTTGVYDPKKELFRTLTGFSIRGVSDILGIHEPTGKFIAIEVKTPQSLRQWLRYNDPKFNPSSKQASAWRRAKDQNQFLFNIKQKGGIAGVAASLDDAKTILEGYA